MARIILGSYMFRYPLGGMLSWGIQYLLGIKNNGHEVYFVEKSGYENSCYNPVAKTMSNDCAYGVKIVSELFQRFNLGENWCFVDQNKSYYGISKNRIDEIFSSADLFIDMGSHGSWNEEASRCLLRVLIDGEPAYTQIKWLNNLTNNIPVPKYDRYFTNGKNIGTTGNETPTLDINWEHVYSPVATEIFIQRPVIKNAPYSTIMNWQSHEPVIYNQKTFGQKDIEFEKFLSLPKLVNANIEVAVSGSNVPHKLLKENKWNIKNAHEITMSFDSFIDYLSYCRAEFSVCKNIFVENHTGWFSDKSAAYLASWRPVILQDTGFSKHLPAGEGLFAVNNIEQAVEAIALIESNYEKHSSAAREIACEYLDATRVMGNFLKQLGI